MSILSSGEPRHAGHVAFGITVLSFPVGLGAFFAGAFTAWVVIPGAGELTQQQWQTRLLATSLTLWLIGMIFVLRYYKGITRNWVGEHRGGNTLVCVECLVAVWTLLAPQIHRDFTAAQLAGLRMFLDGFLILLVLSHVAAYSLLRYKPHLKELVAWSLATIVAFLEISRAA